MCCNTARLVNNKQTWPVVGYQPKLPSVLHGHVLLSPCNCVHHEVTCVTPNLAIIVPACSQLKIVAPRHPITQRIEAGEELFTRAAAAMA